MEVFIGLIVDKEDGLEYDYQLTCDTPQCTQAYFTFNKNEGIVEVS